MDLGENDAKGWGLVFWGKSFYRKSAPRIFAGWKDSEDPSFLFTSVFPRLRHSLAAEKNDESRATKLPSAKERNKSELKMSAMPSRRAISTSLNTDHSYMGRAVRPARNMAGLMNTKRTAKKAARMRMSGGAHSPA